MTFLVMLLSATAAMLVIALPSNVQADPIVCPRIGSNDATSMTLNSGANDFVEVSGLGFSPNQVGPSGFPLFYAVNDQRGRGRKFGVFDSGTGQLTQSIQLPISSFDYESLTVGPCGVEDGDCIYIADVGDGDAVQRPPGREGQHAIHKIKEPRWEDFEDGAVLPESYVTTLWFDYSHASSPTPDANCEAVFLDTVGWGAGGAIGDFYFITKWGGSDERTLIRLFQIPANVWTLAKNDANFVYSPEAVGFYGNGEASNPLMGHIWTRAEMTLDGTLIALGSLRNQYLFLRCPGKSVAETIAMKGSQHCAKWDVAYENGKFETIAWTPDKSRTLEISECKESCNQGAPLVWTTMDYTQRAGTLTCPAFPADTTTKATTPLTPTPTTTTTITTTTTPTASVTSTRLDTTTPTPNDNCVLDEDGTFGNVSSDAVPVNFHFELETDPASGASLQEVMDTLERTILFDLLPDIFGEDCNKIPTERLLRGSTFVPVGASVGPGATLVQGGKTHCLLMWMYGKWFVDCTLRKGIIQHRKVHRSSIERR